MQFFGTLAGRRRITYRMGFCASLVHSVVPGVQVSYEGNHLDDPHVLGIVLEYRRRGDITSGSFEGQPFRVAVGARVVSVIEKQFKVELGPLPKVGIEGDDLRIGPGLVRRGQVIRLTVLADGPAGQLTCESPLADVKVRPRAVESRYRGPNLRQVITWAIVIFIVYYLVSDPHGASDAVQSALRGLRAAGNSLSNFVSKL